LAIFKKLSEIFKKLIGIGGDGFWDGILIIYKNYYWYNFTKKVLLG